MSWLLDLLADAISEFVNGLLDLIGGLIDNMFVAALNANQTSFITGLCNLTSALALALLGVAAVKRVFDVYIMQTKGDSDQNPVELLYRVSLVVAVIGSNGWLWTELKNFSLALSGDVRAEEAGVSIGHSLRSCISLAFSASSGAGSGLLCAFALFIIFLIILLVIFAVITAIKAAEVTLQRVLLPIFAVDLLTSEQEKWNSFLLSYVITFCSYAVQAACFKMAASSIAGLAIDSMRYFVLAVGWIVLAIKSPDWLKKFTYSSGLGRVIGEAGRTASLLLIRI